MQGALLLQVCPNPTDHPMPFGSHVCHPSTREVPGTLPAWQLPFSTISWSELAAVPSHSPCASNNSGSHSRSKSEPESEQSLPAARTGKDWFAHSSPRGRLLHCSDSWNCPCLDSGLRAASDFFPQEEASLSSRANRYLPGCDEPGHLEAF